MTFHDKLGRYAGGFADFVTGDRYDFDKMGKGFKKAENIDLLEREEDSE